MGAQTGGLLQQSLRVHLTQQPLESFTELSTTPTFAALFLSALNNPGKQIRKNEILKALKESSAAMQPSCSHQSNDLVDLLGLLLLWSEKMWGATHYPGRRKMHV